MTTNLNHLFSPELLKKLMDHASNAMQSYLQECNDTPDRVLPWKNPEELRQTVEQLMYQVQGKNSIEDKFDEITRQYLHVCNHLHSPHYIGHQVAPPLTIAAAFAAVNGLTNQSSAVYEMGPFNMAAEKVMVAELGKYIGWKDQPFDGIVTHGGSLANLTALLTARNVRYPESWAKGVPTGVRPAIVTSAESHYSNSRGAGIIGIGMDSVLPVPIDDKRSMDATKLVDVLDQAKRDGLDVFCIMASSCSTPIGAFDDLEAIGKIANERGIWLHVDGAHGATLLLSDKHRHRLNGIERADSVTWDAHKMMFMPSLCTFLFYKDKVASYQTFAQKAPYLFGTNDALDYDGALRTVECTKGAVGMPFFVSWCALGPSVFAKLLDHVIEKTEELYQLLKSTDDFEVIHEPECNILCFRYVPAHIKGQTADVISQFQKQVRERLIKSEKFYIVATVLDGVAALRVTVINPITDNAHFQCMIDAIRAVGSEKP